MFANMHLMFVNVIVIFELISAHLLVICELIFQLVAMRFELVICEIIFELVANKSALFLQFWGVRRHAHWTLGGSHRQMCGAVWRGVAGLRRRLAWRGRGAAPLCMARHVFVQCPARQAWEQIESKFPEIHKQHMHSKLSRKSQATHAVKIFLNKQALSRGQRMRGVQKLQILRNDKICK
jgi:hypothetical protein